MLAPVMFNLFLFLQQNDTLDAILLVRIQIFQLWVKMSETLCSDVRVSLWLQNASSDDPEIQLSAVQAARWGETRMSAQRRSLCLENGANVVFP